MKNISEIRAEQLISQKVNYNGIIMTRAEWCEVLKKEGYKSEVGQKPRVQWNRDKYNRLTGFEQIEYEKRCEEMVASYKLVGPDGPFFEVEKTTFDYFNSLND